MNLTLEEQERAAYLRGDIAQAKLLGELIDAETTVNEVEEKIDARLDQAYQEGYDAGMDEAEMDRR